MATQRPKTKVQLSNGDVLIVPTTERDAKVDAAFRSAVDQVRARNAARVVAFRRARGQAA